MVTVTRLAVLLAITVSSLTSCAWVVPVQKRLANTREQVSDDFQNELSQQLNGRGDKELHATWPEALEKMYQQNPDLITADHRIEDARLRQKQIWRDMIPSLRVSASDSFLLGDIADAFTDPSFRISSFLSLGNLLSLPKRVYTQKLTYIGAELQAENMMRQQVIALYRIFQEQYLLDLEKKALDLELALLANISDRGSAEVISLKAQHSEGLERWQDRSQDWTGRVGDFFIENYTDIDLERASLPKITYKADELDFSDTSRWGFLQLNLLALEEIADQGEVLEVYLRYLPRANLSVSAPPIFSNTSNTEFDINNTRLSPTVSWSLDTRGSISRQLRRLQREAPIKQWRKDKRQRNEIAKLLEGKEQLRDVQLELKKIRSVIDGYRATVKAGLVTDIEQSIKVVRNLRQRELSLATQEIEISSSFWLIDEQRWKSITKRWLETRVSRTKFRKKTNKKSLFTR